MEDQLEQLKERYNKERTIENLNEILELEKNKELYLQRAIHYIEENKFHKALSDLDTTSKLLQQEGDEGNVKRTYKDDKYSSFTTVKQLLARRYDSVYCSTGQFDKVVNHEYENKSVEDIKDYIEYLSSNDEVTLLKTALSYRHINMISQAKKLYKECITKYPGSVNPYASIANMFQNSGDYTKAIKYVFTIMY